MGRQSCEEARRAGHRQDGIELRLFGGIETEIKDGIARCHALSWRTGFRDGPALFSLRPEQIRLAASTSTPDTVRFRAQVEGHAFHGATDLLRVRCSDGLMLSLRASSRDQWQGELELEFSAQDAIPVRESPERN